MMIIKRSRWLPLLMAAAFLFGACAPSLAAQQSGGTLEGLIVDATGSGVTGAVVTVHEVDTHETRTTNTDDTGAFRLTNMPIGVYGVRAERPGFAPYVHAGVTLAIGQTARLVVQLQLVGVVEQVTVIAQPPTLDPRQTSIANVVDTERIEESPVRSRHYLEFVLTTPGVARAAPNTNAGLVSAVLPSSGFSFQGLRPRSNTLTIDGIDNSDEFSGASRTELSLEVVREFQVVQNGWLAENAGAGGGINVVTRSGANVIHGDAFLFGQFGALNARPKREETRGVKPDLARYRAGAAVGGPVAKDRVFYYAAFEREHARNETASDISPSAAAAINAALRTGLLPELATRSLTIGLFPTERAETESSLKITRSLTGHGVVIGSVAWNHNSDQHDAFNGGGHADRTARGSATTQDVAISGSWNTVLSSRAAHEIRGQIATRRQALTPTDTQGPGVSIAGVADFGTAYAGDSDRRQVYWEIGDVVTHSAATHLVKAGGSVKHIGVKGSVADGVHGFYTFRSLDDFLTVRPDSRRVMSGEAAIDFGAWRAGLSLQDHWTPLPALTVDGGVRFDTTRLPASLGMSSGQLSPRMGVAWLVTPSWVVRGGAGWFSDRIVLASIERALSATEHGVVEQVTVDSDSRRSLFTVRPGRWNPASLQASLGAERQLTPNLTATVTYLYASGRNSSRTVNVNLPPPTILTTANAASLGVTSPTPQQIGRLVFGPERIDPSWDGIFELQPSADSTYHGLTVAMNRRLADEFEWSASYTWSHARDSASDFDEQPQNPYALADEWADSRYDQRHRFVATALFDLPIGEAEDLKPGATLNAWARAFSHIEAAPIFSFGSGSPVNAITGGDDTRSGTFPTTSRPLGTPRNAWQLPASATLDLRVLKYFVVKPHGKLDIVVEAFNLLNRTNVTQLNTIFGPGLSPSRAFGRPIEASAARQLQLSIDFEF